MQQFVKEKDALARRLKRLQGEVDDISKDRDRAKEDLQVARRELNILKRAQFTSNRQGDAASQQPQGQASPRPQKPALPRHFSDLFGNASNNTSEAEGPRDTQQQQRRWQRQSAPAHPGGLSNGEATTASSNQHPASPSSRTTNNNDNDNNNSNNTTVTAAMGNSPSSSSGAAAASTASGTRNSQNQVSQGHDDSRGDGEYECQCGHTITIEALQHEIELLREQSDSIINAKQTEVVSLRRRITELATGGSTHLASSLVQHTGADLVCALRSAAEFAHPDTAAAIEALVVHITESGVTDASVVQAATALTQVAEEVTDVSGESSGGGGGGDGRRGSALSRASVELYRS